MKAAWSVSSWTCLPLSLGASQGPSQSRKGHSTCGAWGPPWGYTVQTQPILLPVPSASGCRGRRKGMAPGDLLVLFQLPGAKLRSQRSCPFQ